MDWLKSALNSDSDDSEHEEAIEATSETEDIATSSRGEVGTPEVRDKESISKDDNVTSKDRTIADVDESDNAVDEAIAPQAVPLFNLSTSSRKAEDYDKAVKVEIRKIEPELAYESSLNSEQSAVTGLSQNVSQEEAPDATVKVHGSLDSMEIMQCFNMIHGGGSMKPPKQRDWFGSNIKVTDINADDLRMDRIEKSKQYSLSKAALLEGRTQYKGPTRTLETDDGMVLSTNTLRKTSKRKHQISWLATEAQERELELLERSAQARKTKSETQMKYGW